MFFIYFCCPNRFASFLIILWIFISDSEKTGGRILSTHTNSVAFENPFTIINSTLFFFEPFSHRNLSAVDEEGYFIRFLPPLNKTSLKTVSVDVGINVGIVMNDWLQEIPHMYVIGIEANRKLVHDFDVKEAHLIDRFLLIPAAVSSKLGITTFNTGEHDENNVTDTGSLFGFSDQKKEKARVRSRHKQTVRLLKLSDILKHLAPPRPPLFMWDTLKVDIQGADVDALISAENYLANFMCIVGDFIPQDYKIPHDVPIDPAPTLLKYNFTRIFKGNNEVAICFSLFHCMR
jgi:FkbM family methyltransferase